MTRNAFKYSIAIAYLAFTIWLLFFFPFTPASRLNPQVGRHVFLVPFQSTLHYFQKAWQYHDLRNIMELVMNVGGNLLLFVPVGMMIAHSRRCSKAWPAAWIIGLLLSFTVESIQILTLVGNFDVDDIILNTLGTVLGFVVWKQLAKRKIRHHAY